MLKTVLEQAAIEGFTLSAEGNKIKVKRAGATVPPSAELMGLLRKHDQQLVLYLRPELPRALWRDGMTFADAMNYHTEQTALYQARVGARDGMFYVAAPGSGWGDAHLPYPEDKTSDEPTDVAPGVYPAMLDAVTTVDCSGRELEHYETYVGRARGKLNALHPAGVIGEYKRQLNNSLQNGDETCALLLDLANHAYTGYGVVLAYDGDDEQGYAEIAKLCVDYLLGVQHGKA